MQHLTGKQKRFLRALGQKIQPSIIVGKAGVTPGVAAATEDLLSRRELIKIRVPAGTIEERTSAAGELARAVGVTCIGVVGRTALLYGPDETLAPEARIALPPK